MGSFEIKTNVEVPDFSGERVPIPCPRCELETDVTLGAIKRREYTICRGCHASIRLDDRMGSVRNALEMLENFFRNLGE